MEPATEGSNSPEHPEGLSPDELREAWPVLSGLERVEGMHALPRHEAEDFFFSLGTTEQAQLLIDMPQTEKRSWMRLLAPDDAADLLQNCGPHREKLIELLDDTTRREVSALMAYAEDDAGGLMNPRFVRVRPDMSVDEAISYLRKQAKERVETIYYAYVLDAQQKVQGVVSFRQLFAAQGQKLVSEVMSKDVVTVTEQMDQEAVARLISQRALAAVPVVDSEGRMKGIVTVDDIVDVVQEEATEDIQKLGGTEALDEPYLRISLRKMIQKRAGWLVILFIGEMLTASAMGYFEHEIEKAVVLALFIPLIISSGGNSGSQATTLVIRAMALGEVRMRDWWRVIRRELVSGLALGAILGAIGFLRIAVWPTRAETYGEHWALIGFTVSMSLVGIVLWGALSGSFLPMLLKKLGFDPASASAPFVATLVDVTGLVIYFSVASVVLRGTLL